MDISGGENMRFNEMNYNRVHALEMHDWNDEWVIDRNGNLVMREEYGDEISMETVTPEFGD
jgi:hypothetical protein